MKFMYFSIKYRYSDILVKNINFIYNHLLCCNHTCYCVNMVSVMSVSRYIMSASRYHPRYQSRCSMYIDLWSDSTELAEAALQELMEAVLENVRSESAIGPSLDKRGISIAANQGPSQPSTSEPP